MSELQFEDQVFECRDCHNQFVWTAGEQAFYAEKGLQNRPQRCPDCRRAAKAARNSGGAPDVAVTGWLDLSRARRGLSRVVSCDDADETP